MWTMAIGFSGSKGTGFALALFALASVAGTCASLYAMVVAYLAGSSAQASIDGCPAADPMALARASMAELGRTTDAAAQEAVIDVDESTVVVADAAPKPGCLHEGVVGGEV